MRSGLGVRARTIASITVAALAPLTACHRRAVREPPRERIADSGVRGAISTQSPLHDPELVLSRVLPDHAGVFDAGAFEGGDGYVRRPYTRGMVRISVTVARTNMTGPAYEMQWVRMSAGYPEATLDVPAGEGSGFFDCSGDDPGASCNLHVQLRNGYHVELMSNGGPATRDELESLLSGLPMRWLSSREE